MSKPAISTRQLSDTLSLCECHPTSDHKGAWWIWDETQKMNLAMGEATEEAAFLEVIDYYQNRLGRVEKELKHYKSSVEQFINQFEEES